MSLKYIPNSALALVINTAPQSTGQGATLGVGLGRLELLLTEFLQQCAFGFRSTHHTTLQASPGQLVFGRDMIHSFHCRLELHSDQQAIIN